MPGTRATRVCCPRYLNACYQTGFADPIDEAIRGLPRARRVRVKKFDEVPYDFIRKRLSICVSPKTSI